MMPTPLSSFDLVTETRKRQVDEPCPAAVHPATWPLLAALLLTACASDAPYDPSKPVAPVAASAPSVGPQSVPGPVAEAIANYVGRQGSDASGQIELSELELGPQGPRALVARGVAALCDDSNCPYGVFLDDAGKKRPVLMGMSGSAPTLHSIGHLGFADLSMSAIDSSREFRITRFQWEGEAYRPATCRLVNRTTQESRACVPTHPQDVPLLDAVPPRLCDQMKRMASHHAKGDIALSNAFVVRRDSGGHVEALRLKGRVSTKALQPLVRCLRHGGMPLLRLHGEVDTAGLSTTNWLAPTATADNKRESARLTATYVPASDYTLVSLSLFPPARRSSH